MVPEQVPLPTICIATDAVDKPSETFIRRHVRHLNGGNTVAMAQSRGGEEALGKPLLVWRRPHKLRRLLGRLDRRPLLPGLPPDPFAAEFHQFVRANRVGFLLAEFGTVGVELYELAREAELPMFCYFRGYDASRKLSNPRYRAHLQRMFDHIDGIVAVSTFLLDQLAGYGLRHENAMVIPSGVDFDRFSAGDKDPDLILSVGRMIEKKAPLTTIRAFAAVANEHPALRLEVVGDGPLLAASEAEAKALGVGDRVLFHGVRDHDFVAERMSRASIFMLHSVTAASGDTEGLPTVVQEAMAAGAVVLSTRHAGISDIVVTEQTGLLVEEHDAVGYAAALERLVGDHQLRADLSGAARQLAEQRLDYTRLYQRLEEAMAVAIAERKSHR